jgi:ankyrin repeat protein
MKNLHAVSLVLLAFASHAAFAAPVSKKADGIDQNAPQYHQPSKVTKNFCEAASNGNLEMMELFMQQGAEIDNENCTYATQTPLMASAQHRYYREEVFNFLLDHNANPNYQTKHGETSLMYLAERNTSNDVNDTDSTVRAIERLFAHGAKVDLEDANGNTALDHAITIGYEDSFQMRRTQNIIRYLVSSKNADVNHKNNKGDSPLMKAAKGCGVNTVNLLIALGANTEIRNTADDTAVSLAAEGAARESSGGSCTEVVKILQKAKQDEKSKPSSLPSGAAVQSGQALVDIVKKYEKDKTSYSQVVNDLGNPISIDVDSASGKKMIFYGGATAPFNTVSSIPVPALFGGKSSLKETYFAVLIFDKNNVLTGINAMKLGQGK